jgi:hypothetical protein
MSEIGTYRLGIEEYMGGRYLEAASVIMREERAELGDERMASSMSSLLQTEEFDDLIASTNESVRHSSEEPLVERGGETMLMESWRDNLLPFDPLLHVYYDFLGAIIDILGAPEQSLNL